jgi:prolyl 4-hydroxylase
MDYSIITSMDVAGFVISIIALIFSMLALGLALRAIYIIGVNAGLANKKPTIKTKTPPKQTQAEPKKPIRVDGDKVIYNEDPLVYVIENFISEEECDHFVNQSKDKLERAKTIGGKDGIYHEKRTGMNCWIPHAHSETSKAIGDRVAELIGFPLRNAESYQVVYYTGGTEYNDHHDAFDHETEEGRKHLTRGGQRIYTALGYLNDVEEGGATEFRDLNISIPPKKGSLLVWKNILPGTTKVHPASLHAGRPVTKGEKYAFNLWFRENKFV